MWTCNTCGRMFEKDNQPHTCRKIPLEEHFQNKNTAKEIFNYLVRVINEKVGGCQIISLPCCVHLFGAYDFLVVLPKKDRLEIRFSLHRKLETPKLKLSIPVSKTSFKHCVDVRTIEEIDDELIKWLDESYRLTR